MLRLMLNRLNLMRLRLLVHIVTWVGVSRVNLLSRYIGDLLLLNLILTLAHRNLLTPHHLGLVRCILLIHRCYHSLASLMLVHVLGLPLCNVLVRLLAYHRLLVRSRHMLSIEVL